MIHLLLMRHTKAWLALIAVYVISVSAQGQYKSLLWKISGGGLKKPSYLYGTMHISSRVAFQLGDPFYDAIQSTDVVALELEPDEWLKSLFADAQVDYLLGSAEEDTYHDEFAYDSPLPNLHGWWALGGGEPLSERIRQAILYEPDILNYLMFRYGEDNAAVDFEEDTWLDMHIYQTAKKMGRQTIGLETYEQSDACIRKAGIEEARENDNREWDEGDIREFERLNAQLEPAYRAQDLDLIDSLSRLTASKAFYTYILQERNKLFVHTIDSVLNAGQSVFAAMGCAHLPGSTGVIELLKAMGYNVTPLNKGSRNAKRRKELDRNTYDRSFESYTTPDGLLSFSTPVTVYQAAAGRDAATWLAIDMANGANYTVTRLKSYASVSSLTKDDLTAIIDSVLAESIAGELVYRKSLRSGNYSGVEVENKTRRGDYRRAQVWILPDEILILKLAATGEKVKQGYGSPFFEKLIFHESIPSDLNWVSADSSIAVLLPSKGVCYNQKNTRASSPDFEVMATDVQRGTYYILQRHVAEDAGFLDEDAYELHRCLRAFAQDRSAQIRSQQIVNFKGYAALDAILQTNQSELYARIVVQGLSYVVISTNENDSLIRVVRFNSLQPGNAPYHDFFDYNNSELFFQTKLPYLPIDEKPSLEAIMFNPDLEGEHNGPFGTTASLVLNPPHDAQSIQIDFQRYHEYSDGEDKQSFLRDKRDLVLGLDMQLLSEKVQWNSNGATFDFVVGDTGTCRRYLHKMVLHNKAFYHLSTCFDSTAGPSDFIRMAFDYFKSTDTIFPYPHFELRDSAYLADLISSDTLLRKHAIEITTEMDFSAPAVPAMREVLTQLTNLDVEDAQVIRTKLTAGLAADTTRANIDFIVRQFNAFPDSADYQYELLSVLLQMKTREAWRIYTRLVVEEPPIMFDEMGGSGCETLFDSVRLAAPLLPQLMQLLAIEEYELSIYHLMAMAADSGWLPIASYRYLVPQILVEARNEWKRLRNSKNEEYGLNTDVLRDYCALLEPIRKEKEVAAFFDKAYSTKNIDLLMDLVRFDWDQGHVPSDSLIHRLSKANEHVHDLYAMLREHNSASKMPAAFSTRSVLAELHLKNGYESEKGYERGREPIDSIVLVDRHPETIRGTKLDVFFYKVYKPTSGQWLGHVIAFDDRDPKDAWPLFIESERSVVLDSDEDPMRELQAEYFFMEENNREFVNFGSGAGDFSVYWY